ncbi:MAG TPA: hypothetical protein DCM40_25085 [Maribacter sp.]|nr:hypothetical protein [Maribacter sp.]
MNKVWLSQTRENDMKKVDKKTEQPFRNVALLPEDHKLLRELAELDQRTMTRQLSVIIRREHSDMFKREAS